MTILRVPSSPLGTLADHVRQVEGREDAALKRENAVSLREGEAQVREQVASDRNVDLLAANQKLIAVSVRAQDLADAADIARTEQERFLAMLAHELRNPLAPIRNAMSVLGRTTVEDPLVPWAREIVERQVSQMSRLLDDLLDASRISRGVVVLQRRPVSVVDIVEQAIAAHRTRIDLRRQQLQVVVPMEAVCIDGDPLRLVQMLGNLLHNASKFTPIGGSLRLEVRVEEEGWIELRVRDAGCGLSASALLRVFDLFSQEDRSLSHSQGGLGIGLAVVRSMAELHGGTVVAVSDGVARGSEFIVRLPRLSLALDPALPVVFPSVAAIAPVGRRVLIVDDNLDLRETLAIFLQMAGHQVSTADDGLIALEKILTQLPEVVVCDVGLPGLDGYGVAERVVAELAHARPWLVAVTGYGQPADRQRALDAGFDEYLVKPIDPDRLVEIIATRFPCASS